MGVGLSSNQCSVRNNQLEGHRLSIASAFHLDPMRRYRKSRNDLLVSPSDDDPSLALPTESVLLLLLPAGEELLVPRNRLAARLNFFVLNFSRSIPPLRGGGPAEINQ